MIVETSAGNRSGGFHDRHLPGDPCTILETPVAAVFERSDPPHRAIRQSVSAPLTPAPAAGGLADAAPAE